MKRGEQQSLFDGGSLSEVSDTFTVHSGRGVMLSLFGIPCEQTNKFVDGCTPVDQNLYIEKVAYTTGILPQGVGCDHKSLDASQPSIMSVEYVAQCGLWAMDVTQNIGVITVPGTYRVVIEDPDLVGLISLYAIGLNYEDVMLIPDDLLFGKTSGLTCD